MKTYFYLFSPLLMLSNCDTPEKGDFSYLNAESIIIENAQVEDSVPPGEEEVPSCYLSVWFAGKIQESDRALPEKSVSYIDAPYGNELPQSYKSLPTRKSAGIDITCNRDLGGYPAGTSLMRLFSVKESSGLLPWISWKENAALSAEIARGNVLWMNPAYDMLYAHPDPGRGLDCTYTVTVTLEDGRRLQGSIRRGN